MQSTHAVVTIAFCAIFLAGCSIGVSTSPDPAAQSASQSSSVVTNDKGVVSVTRGVDERTYRLTTLPSGKKIKLIHMGPIHFAKGGAPPALMLKYRTDLPIDDVPALLTEAKEIWEDFRVEAEKGGYTGAAISAYDAPTGDVVWKSNTYTFVWEKDEHGEWHHK